MNNKTRKQRAKDSIHYDVALQQAQRSPERKQLFETLQDEVTINGFRAVWRQHFAKDRRKMSRKTIEHIQGFLRQMERNAKSITQ